jgi:hypothetical protein
MIDVLLQLGALAVAYVVVARGVDWVFRRALGTPAGRGRGTGS